MSGSRFICSATLLVCVTVTAAPNDARAMFRGGGHFNFNPGGGGFRGSSPPYAAGARQNYGAGAPGNGVNVMRNGGPNGFPGEGRPTGGYGYEEPPPWAHRNAGVEYPRGPADEPIASDGDAHGHWPPPRWHRPISGAAR